jgi:hypothetical protein
MHIDRSRTLDKGKRVWKKNQSRPSCAEINTLGKADRAMETNEEGTYFQGGDHVRIKSTQETGRVHAADGGVVYVLMDETHETKLFSARAGEDAYIELVTEAAGTMSQEP